MNGKSDLALLGIVLAFLGVGVCIVAALGSVDASIIDLPLGPLEDQARESAHNPRHGTLVGIVMLVIGVALISLASLRRDRSDDAGAAPPD